VRQAAGRVLVFPPGIPGAESDKTDGREQQKPAELMQYGQLSFEQERIRK